jgi:hypothetical protein
VWFIAVVPCGDDEARDLSVTSVPPTALPYCLSPTSANPSQNVQSNTNAASFAMYTKQYSYREKSQLNMTSPWQLEQNKILV